VEPRGFFRPGAASGPTSLAAYKAKLDHLTATIEAIPPDVLGVQEVGQPEALEELRAALGAGWQAICSQHPDGRGICVTDFGSGQFSGQRLTSVSGSSAVGSVALGRPRGGARS